MNKLAHGFVVAAFAAACGGLWSILTLSEQTAIRMLEGNPLPAFVRLCLGLKSYLWVLPLLALAYCLVVWVRKSDGQKTWVGFFATTVYAVVLLAFPVVISCWLMLTQLLLLAAKR